MNFFGGSCKNHQLLVQLGDLFGRVFGGRDNGKAAKLCFISDNDEL